MKYKLNITKEQGKNFLYFTLGLLVLLEVIFYKSGFTRILLVSLKLSLLVHLAGYLIALRLFKEEFDEIALLFLGLSFGLILAAFWYYIPTLFEININSITYVVPIVLLLIGLGLHVGKGKEKKDKKEELMDKSETKEEKINADKN
ncbi:MAG: hypothetical protein AABX04_08520 [Nanoarchaeota archaeon]